MSDVELAGTLTVLLPAEYQEKLAESFDRFEQDMNSSAIDSEEAQTRFCRFMELFWLTIYNGKNEYAELQKSGYFQWRKCAEDMQLKLQRKAATA